MINFQDIYKVDNTKAWMSESFNGFSLDSRYVQQGQIFIAFDQLFAARKNHTICSNRFR